MVSKVLGHPHPYPPPLAHGLVHFTPSHAHGISFTENTPSCVSFAEPIINDSLSVVYTLDIHPPSDPEPFYIDCNGPQLCTTEELDRETSGDYSITLTAKYLDTVATNATDCQITETANRRKRRDVSGQNEIIFIVTVEDQADNPPVFVFPSDKIHQFYLAAIDSATIGTSLGTIEGTDADATYDLRFSLQAVSGDSDLINVDSVTGEVRTKDLLYPTLADAARWTYLNGSGEVEYTVSLCDSPSASAECSSTALTFKVLLSSDHIIIRIDESVEEVKGKQDDLVRCMATAMEIEIFVQFISPRMESATSTPDSSKTDLWLYAVDPNGEWSKYMTFQDFKNKTEATLYEDGTYTCDGTDFEVTPLRLSSVRPNIAIQAYQAWVPLTLAFIIFIGNLICILLLWLSWKQMLMEGGNDISRTLSVREQGIVNPVFDPDQDAEERYISTQKEDAAVEAREEEEEEEEEGTQETQEEEAESVTGSEDPLITKVYLTDGTNTTEITLAEGDAPQNAEQIADTEEHNRLVPIPPLMMDTREYETNEATMDVYPFDEPDEEISVTGNPEEEGAVNIIGESPNDDHPYSTKIFPNTSERELTESPTTEAAVVESPPHIPDPDYDQVEETDNNGKEPPYVNVASEKRASSPPELPDPDYEVMAPGGQQPAAEPIPAVDTGYENVIPFQPTTTGNDADAARPEGKTVTFGGETVVGQGAGDGTSTLDGSAESDSGHSSPATKHASLPDQDEVIGKMGNDSEPSTVDYLEDESLISGGDFPEVGVTSL
ncbi:uncharacterized protein [Diadema antillarum]|uniref:uncharacterized protein n=1 Tax=Diadema antillarum TaxID=105358 RepID=UPI003A8C6611